ncbi:hypothetical protein [Iningainema tapete]|uniref:Uncharacterized protein n=1 Tax=Iningainema tapete BLCC-T55 TaxID=2748662 RepID=A0A8J7C8S1_9CYAN|nr:hypothetical protein [Iningainema tapete]MBD2777104.1 hypothetical protein [Iningainema tapete BLCC-T55]
MSVVKSNDHPVPIYRIFAEGGLNAIAQLRNNISKLTNGNEKVRTVSYDSSPDS